MLAFWTQKNESAVCRGLKSNENKKILPDIGDFPENLLLINSTYKLSLGAIKRCEKKMCNCGEK